MTPEVLPEIHSEKAARILAAARSLLLSRGVKGLTVAEVAQKAYVGKGTLYLFWETKEDLIIGLVAREILSTTGELIDHLDSDPALASPDRFCPTMVATARGRPLMAALADRDEAVLGLLATHPRAAALDAALGPGAILRGVLPVWRGAGIVGGDWDIEDQTVALNALAEGIMMTLTRPVVGSDADPLQVLGRAVAILLGVKNVDDKQLTATAAAIIDLLNDGRNTVLTSIAGQQAAE
ncbi:hypothetical protein BVC93_13200 [Mycobacterium sp. MS1601]|uniref:TetR/AcrR family transcriptional regulator n=1 Tax=Mycobacterium sp. MS1601 TaxID=1936029 RepID=UPI0009796D33|nr:TetR/AcrR family transcriptional regulator [Mycobacterium sp. MS1601]AQA03216.1 hypothetical protein BVC93_13200 [Mycobacterium sp. MS1601]